MNDPNIEKYKEKIRKLLALTASPNANEALVAATKARGLMFKYHLSECDVEKPSVDEVFLKQILFRSRWELDLFNVIAKNCRCEMYASIGNITKNEVKYSGYINCLGFRDDIDFTIEMFKYLHKSAILHAIETEKKLSPERTVLKSKSFYIGFIEGVKKAFEDQNASHSDEWGLIVKTPESVKEKYEEKTKGSKTVMPQTLAPQSQNDIVAARLGKKIGFELTKAHGKKELEE